MRIREYARLLGVNARFVSIIDVQAGTTKQGRATYRVATAAAASSEV